jgi:hypothetical protein
MRRLLVIVLSLTSATYSMTEVSAARSTNRGWVCCEHSPYPYMFPANVPTYTPSWSPYYVNSNLYFYRSYYPYRSTVPVLRSLRRR